MAGRGRGRGRGAPGVPVPLHQQTLAAPGQVGGELPSGPQQDALLHLHLRDKVQRGRGRGRGRLLQGRDLTGPPAAEDQSVLPGHLLHRDRAPAQAVLLLL